MTPSGSRYLACMALAGLMHSITPSAHAAAQPRPPNVVLILADDLGYGDLSSYGQDKYQTPAIDRIASEGVKATQYYVPVPYCAPSRASLLTGRFPLRHGMIANPHPDTTPEADQVGLSSKERTIGEIYQQAGYRTGIIGKWHLGHHPQFYPTRHGFHEYYGILYSNDMLPVRTMENETVAEDPVDQRLITTRYTARAVDFIGRHQRQPFFLYLAHTMPHTPLAVSDKYYTPGTPGDLYHDVMRELDWSVGEVMKALRDNGLFESTIVIFTSDNGPHYGGSTGGLKGKKATPWEGGTRVPFMIRYPAGLPQNTAVHTPVACLDVFPTLLELCAIAPPAGIRIDGESLVDLLRGKVRTHGPIFTAQRDKIITVRDGAWKLYVNPPQYLSARDLNPDWVDPKAPNGTTLIAQVEQPTSMAYPGLVPKRFPNPLPLFNLESDPTESIDQAATHPEIVAKLRREFERFLATMPARDRTP
jgi:arylsulfatase A-like enzyme